MSSRDLGVVRDRAPLPARRGNGGGDRPVAALTVDVEDWYQSCFDLDAPISDRVVRNVDRVLAFLEERSARATFFVQGLVAEAFPQLIASIADLGHEVQSHGHTHRSLRQLDPDGLRDELERGRAAVEDACGVRPTAFRAPDFSILRENLWALEVLAELGFELDSSIFPARTRRYGIAGWDVAPQRLTLASGAEILEVPVSVSALGPARFPVAGGGYFRLLPRSVLEPALRRIAASGRPVVVYCHPYEFSPEEPAEYRGRVPARARVLQGIGRPAMVGRLASVMQALPFGRLQDVLAASAAA